MWIKVLLIIVALTALYLLLVVPGERAHHKRKLDIIQKKIGRVEKRRRGEGSGDSGDEN